jgi:Holliday junction resolvase-like predicted endonuclease
MRRTGVYQGMARDNFDEAAEAIGRRQQNRIIGAAQPLAAHPEDVMRDMRFDAILVVPGACRATCRRHSMRRRDRRCNTAVAASSAGLTR